MKNNKTKVITIAALIIAVIALSIGFAAFASTLNISTGASVTPNDTFVVKFSKENGSLVDDQPVQASEGSQYGGSTTINNSDVKNPTIGNLSASFTQPGQSVTYTFYVRNMGNYDAYLTDVKFNNAQGKQVFKSCISSGTNPGTQSIVDDVCDDITFTLELEDTPNKVLTSESNFAQVVGNDYKVLKSTTPESGTTNSKMVKVTIEYPNKDGVHYADGSFTVNFGSVEMIFATLAGYTPSVSTPQQASQDYSSLFLSYEPGVLSNYIGTSTDVVIPDGLMLPVLTGTFNSLKCETFVQENFSEDLVESGKTAGQFCADEVEPGISEMPVNMIFLYHYDSMFDFSYSNQQYLITSIGEEAFNEKGLTSLSISNDITAIGESAFKSNGSLTNVILPTNLSEIGESAFANNGLSSITIPSSVVSIGRRAFEGNGLQNVDFSNATSLTSIGNDAFSYNSLTILDLSAAYNLSSIGEGSFENIGLKEIYIGSGITNIGRAAFANNLLNTVHINVSCDIYKSSFTSNNQFYDNRNQGTGSQNGFNTSNIVWGTPCTN